MNITGSYDYRDAIDLLFEKGITLTPSTTIGRHGDKLDALDFGVPGLAIVQCSDHEGRWYTISHIADPDGMSRAITQPTANLYAAICGAVRALDFDFDWNRSQAEIAPFAAQYVPIGKAMQKWIDNVEDAGLLGLLD